LESGVELRYIQENLGHKNSKTAEVYIHYIPELERYTNLLGYEQVQVRRKNCQTIYVKQVAEYLQVNERTIYKLAQVGKIPCFKVAGTWRFWKREIDEWTRNRSTKLEKEDDK